MLAIRSIYGLSVPVIFCLLALANVGVSASETTSDQGPIHYQDILEDPDNSAQNIAYAKQLIGRGELRHAAATLERVLLLDPGQTDVRLLYASVLIRLDSLTQARVELASLESQDLSPNQRNAVRKLLNSIDGATYGTRLTGYVGLGMLTDDNSGANPASGTALAFDVPLPSGNDVEDTSVFSMGFAAIHHDMNSNRNNQFFSTLSLYNSDQQDLDYLDYWTVGLKLGFLLNRGDRKYRFGPTGRVLELDGQKYYQSVGVSFRADGKLSPEVNGWLWARVDEEDFYDLVFAGFSHLRSGQRRRVGAGFTYFGSSNMQYSLEGQFDQKDADYDPFGYNGLEARARVRRTFGGNGNLWADVTYRGEDYDGANLLVSTIEREDDLYRYQVGVSFALSDLLNRNANAGRNAAKLNLSYSYYDSQSNVPNYDFESNRFRLGLTKAFSAGF